MMKPHETTIAGKDYFAWQYEEQTQVKHKLLAYYWRIVNSENIGIPCLWIATVDAEHI